MKFLGLAVAFLTFGALSGCAHHQTMRGSVAMKTSGREAHVCLGEGEVKVGDRVGAYRNECKPNIERMTDRGVKDIVCKMIKIGGGKVVGILNEHYSTVEFDDGVPFKEGTIVQKE